MAKSSILGARDHQITRKSFKQHGAIEQTTSAEAITITEHVLHEASKRSTTSLENKQEQNHFELTLTVSEENVNDVEKLIVHQHTREKSKIQQIFAARLTITYLQKKCFSLKKRIKQSKNHPFNKT